MISIFWFPLGFPVIAAIPLRPKSTAAYFCSDIILKIVEGIPFDLANSLRQLMGHINNTTAHLAAESITCLKKFRIRPIDHSTCSPDLALSDFYLGGQRKGALAGNESESSKELLLAVRGVTASMGWAEFESVFDAWDGQLSEYIQMKGEYVAQGESKRVGENPNSHARLRS
jgi:hypothetical protein